MGAGFVSYVFYDTETTGTSTSFDQILQFGAIRTDAEFNEIDRFEIRCRLLPYIVPSPGALLVTRVTVDQLTDPSLPSHYQMMQAIKAKLEAWSPSIFIGYNSLRFDEKLLRQAFYKTLHRPYLTNSNGNTRSCGLQMLRAVSRLAPDTLRVPQDEKGAPVFKLDQMAPLNGFDHSAAHDAMADVEATIHMCRGVAERTPEYWNNFMRLCTKNAVTDFVFGEEIYVLVNCYSNQPTLSAVTTLGSAPTDRARVLAFDLAQDPRELEALDDEELLKRLPKAPRPVRAFRSNEAPVVMTYDEVPAPLHETMPDCTVLSERASYLRARPDLCKRLIEVFSNGREPYKPSIHVEEQIHDSFDVWNSDALQRFHTIDWPERAALLPLIPDARIRTLGKRILYEEAPDLLDAGLRSQFNQGVARRLLSDPDAVPWLTLPKAIADTDAMLVDADAASIGALSEIKEYLVECSDWAKAFLA